MTVRHPDLRSHSSARLASTPLTTTEICWLTGLTERTLMNWIDGKCGPERGSAEILVRKLDEAEQDLRLACKPRPLNLWRIRS